MSLFARIVIMCPVGRWVHTSTSSLYWRKYFVLLQQNLIYLKIVIDAGDHIIFGRVPCKFQCPEADHITAKALLKLAIF